MEQQIPPSKLQRQPGPLRLDINAAPVPRPNWTLEDMALQSTSIPYHLQQRHAAISSTVLSGYAADPSNVDELAWRPMTSLSPEEAGFSSGSFPQRRGEPDCGFYVRTGHCGYGMKCRYNHPPNRTLAAALAKDRGEYPERVGQPECQYYMKTGTCKFGITCKFHHPKDRTAYSSNTPMNTLGYPLRSGEIDCPYYMRTGSCKFAATCKFNHPQPPMVRGLVALPGSSVYSNGSSTTPSAHPFQGMPSWGMPRSPYVPRSRFQGPSAFASVVVQPQNIVSMPGWNGAYPTRMGPQQPVLGSTSFVYGASSINEGSSSSIPSAYTPYVPGSANSGLPQALQAGFTAGDFPERPGEQVCQYYIKTGDCKFGMSCRYHHPKDRASLIPVCTLSPLGLPIRQGAAQCTFYMQNGTCKFGSTCKFDHPMGEKILIYSPSSSSLMDLPVAPSPVALPVATPMPPSDSVDHGTIMFHTRQRSASGTEKKQGYKETYPGDSAGEGSTQQSNYKSSSSVGSNGSVSNTETAEVRGESKDTSSVSL